MKKLFCGLLTLTILSLSVCAYIVDNNSDCAEKIELEIAFLGDSITHGGRNDNWNYSFHLSKAEYIKNVQNLGISGSTIGFSRFPFTERYQAINESTDAIFVFGGTNDYGSGENQMVPLGRMGDKTNQTFYGALEVLITGIRSRYIESDLYFITPLQRDDAWWGYPTTSPQNDGGYTLLQYRNAIIETCDKYSLKYLDFYSLSSFQLRNNIFKELMSDGLHPNEKGHKIMAKEIEAFLRLEYNCT